MRYVEYDMPDVRNLFFFFQNSHIRFRVSTEFSAGLLYTFDFFVLIENSLRTALIVDLPYGWSVVLHSLIRSDDSSSDENMSVSMNTHGILSRKQNSTARTLGVDERHLVPR